MIHWCWVVLAMIVGACVGALLMGVCAANSNEKRGKRWWDE